MRVVPLGESIFFSKQFCFRVVRVFRGFDSFSQDEFCTCIRWHTPTEKVPCEFALMCFGGGVPDFFLPGLLSSASLCANEPQ
jgi:hypothetical protein